jgi:O-antigen/teichoic acid export membrane protein
VATCTWAVGFLASMTGHQRQSAIGLAVAVVLNALLNLWLIPAYGIVGAAAASALSLGAWQIAMVVLIRRAVGVDPTLMSIVRLRDARPVGSPP